MGVYLRVNEHWQPWVNTVAYYPLDNTNTVNDLSWNGYNLTNNWATFTTLNGVECVQTGSSKYLTSTTTVLPTWSASRTISVWCNLTTNNSFNLIVGYWQSANDYDCLLYVRNSTYTFYSDSFYSSNSSATTWTRALYTVTYDWTTLRQYINWTKVKEDTATLNTTAVSASYPFAVWIHNEYLSSAFNWYISNVIVENKTRTEQEIEDYYNHTKSNYWL